MSKPDNRKIPMIGKTEVKNILEVLSDDNTKLRKSRIILLSTNIDDCIASGFICEMMLMIREGKSPIRVIISSEGGDLLSGLGIIRAIQYAQTQGIQVDGEVFGQALSMAFFILQSCDKRVMGNGDFIMCHGVFVQQGSDRKGRKAEDKMLDTAEDFFCRMLSEKNTSNKKEFHDPDYWRVLLEEDTPNYYSADEAMDLGLIDEVFSK
jgi:ATP-dependent protease ClpP protease subunit